MVGENAFFDGINETGFSAAIFYLPGFTEYAPYNPKQAKTRYHPAICAVTF